MLTYIQPFDPIDSFPPLQQAEKHPNGLLAIGGDLSVARLKHAYRRGIFPWYNENEIIQWWSPDPRMVLPPGAFHASRSLRKTVRKQHFNYSVNHCFEAVIQACAAGRRNTDGTWINPDMIEAYNAMHHEGYAHSIEIWQAGKLVGGLYGIALGRIFYGESMFSRTSDASKAAFWALSIILKNLDYKLVDCQLYSDHLASMGAREISRSDYEKLLDQYCDVPALLTGTVAAESLAGLVEKQPG